MRLFESGDIVRLNLEYFKDPNTIREWGGVDCVLSYPDDSHVNLDPTTGSGLQGCVNQQKVLPYK